MPASFNIRLDTTAPQGVVFELAGGFAVVTDPNVAIALTTVDPDTTGYQIKLWGDIDPDFNPSIQDTEGASGWLDYGTIPMVLLTDGDGLKTVHAKIRDDVGNETAVLTDTATLDTTAPVVTITVDPDRIKISKVAPWDEAHFTFIVDSDIEAYIVSVVPDPGSTFDQGIILIDGDAPSPADTPIPVTITGQALQDAVGADGDYVIKVFAKEAETGYWSV